MLLDPTNNGQFMIFMVLYGHPAHTAHVQSHFTCNLLVENNQANILWDFQMSNLPDIVVVDKQSMAVVIDAVIEAVICIPTSGRRNIRNIRGPRNTKG